MFLFSALPDDAFVVPPVLSSLCLHSNTIQTCLEDLFSLISEVVTVHEGRVVRQSGGCVVGERARQAVQAG